MSPRHIKRLAAVSAIAAAIPFASFASVSVRDDFETSRSDYVAADATEDDSALVAYDNDAPSIAAPYPLSGFGEKYLSIDAGDTKLWRTVSASSSVYLDMVVQFTLSPEAPVASDGEKIVVYADSDGYLTVIAADSAEDVTATTYRTTTTVTAGTWGRITISAIAGDSLSFQIRKDGTLLQTENGKSTFSALVSGTTVAGVGFGGTGRLDDFVVRTTDPYFSGDAVASIGSGDDCEKYATLDEALADANGATVTLLADNLTSSLALASGDSYSINVNGHVFAGLSGADGVVVSSAVADGVTVYTAATAVCSVNGTLYASFVDAMAVNTAENRTTLVADSSAAILIPAGSTLYLAEGDYTFSGTFDGAGTVNLAAKPKAYSASSNTSLFAATWTGVFQIAWNPNGGAFAFNEFGNENSFVEIATEFTAYPATAWSGGSVPTINPTIILSADWYVKDGWGKTDASDNATTIRTLTGSAKLYLDGTGSGTTDICYNINTVSNFTGYIVTGGNNWQGYDNWANEYGRGSFKIGNIYTDGTIAFGTPLVKIHVHNNSIFRYRDLAATTVNGVARPLMVDDETDDARGIYLTAAVAEIDDVETPYKSVEAAVAAANDAATSATDAPSVTVYDGSALSDGWTLSSGTTYVLAAKKAYIGETGYFSIANALAAAGSAETTISLVAADAETVTLPSSVTLAVSDDVVFSGVLSGSGKIKYTKAPASFVTASLLADDWTGAYVADYDITGDTSFNVNAYGTENSKFEIASGRTLSGYFNLPGASVIPELVVSGSVTLSNGYSDAGKEVTISKLSGNGVVSINRYYNYYIAALGDWTGRVVLTNWSTKNIEQYGCAGSTIELAGDVAGYLGRNGSNAFGAIAATVVFSGTTTMENGWSDGWTREDNLPSTWAEDNVVKFSAAKVTGALTLAYSGTYGGNKFSYYFGSLDAAGGGTITVGNRSALRIDAVDFAVAPSGTSRIYPVVIASGSVAEGVLCGPTGTKNEKIPVTVNGVANGQYLVYVADATAPGLYLVPSVKGFRAEIR